MNPPKLSVVIPVYNEQNTIEEIAERVHKIDIPKEVIIVDDASTDSTPERLKRLETHFPNTVIVTQQINMGKGRAVREGFSIARGEYVIIQDADLEYDPEDYYKLIEPLERDRADVVYGSRLSSTQAHRVLYFGHYIANKMLTFLSNIFTGLNLTDM